MINKTLRKKLLKDWYQFFSSFYFFKHEYSENCMN